MMDLTDLTTIKDFAAAIQSTVTAASFIVGGIWVYRKYIKQEKYPNLETSADVNFVGFKGDYWIVELLAYIENKGKAQHRMSNIQFDLNAIYADDPIETSAEIGGQVYFPRQLAAGSFLPEGLDYFFIDPAVTAKYSYISSVPKDARFIILHIWFSYTDRKGSSHSAERTIRIPTEDELLTYRPVDCKRSANHVLA